MKKVKIKKIIKILNYNYNNNYQIRDYNDKILI